MTFHNILFYSWQHLEITFILIFFIFVSPRCLTNLRLFTKNCFAYKPKQTGRQFFPAPGCWQAFSKHLAAFLLFLHWTSPSQNLLPLTPGKKSFFKPMTIFVILPTSCLPVYNCDWDICCEWLRLVVIMLSSQFLFSECASASLMSVIKVFPLLPI